MRNTTDQIGGTTVTTTLTGFSQIQQMESPGSKQMVEHEVQPVTPFTPPPQEKTQPITAKAAGKVRADTIEHSSSRSDSVSSGSDTKRLSFLIAKDTEQKDLTLIEHERIKKLDLQKYGKKLGDIRGWWGSLSTEEDHNSD